MTIKPSYFNEIESKNLRTRMLRLNDSTPDCRLHEKMLKSSLKQRKQRRLTENKKKSSSLP